jgi:glycerol-3-phosphate dehydrogenase
LTGASFDLLIIGGGINGAGIARDATGRGLKVMLVEQDDLAAHTSSASSGLIHGGLRYLEHGEFRLVRESLLERARLLAIAPHIVRPLRFILPRSGGMRPAWLIRAGLFLYDHLGPRAVLPPSERVSLAGSVGAPLEDAREPAFSYYDCRVDDARLVILNAVDAGERGAVIRTHTRFLGAEPAADAWTVRLNDQLTGVQSEVCARVIVNAAGPWVQHVVRSVAGSAPERPPRLVKGSHIVLRRRHEGEHAYILQNSDGRVMFALPYEEAFTLIGTTDTPFTGDPAAARIDSGEIAYLCGQASRHFREAVTEADIVSSYSGVRPLYDDGTAEPARVTRVYVLKLGTTRGPQVLSIYGG